MWTLVVLISGQAPGILKVLLHGGRRGKDTSLLSHGFYKEGLYFYTMPCFAFLAGTEKCRIQREGCWAGAETAACGKGRREVGGKGTRFSALPLRAAGVWWSGPKQSSQGQEGERLKCAQEIAGSKSCRDVRGVACVEKKGFQNNLTLSNLTKLPVLALSSPFSKAGGLRTFPRQHY